MADLLTPSGLVIPRSVRPRPEPPRVLIACPCYDGWVHHRFTESILASIQHLQECGVQGGLAFRTHEQTAAARNILFMTALRDGYSHLLFADADQAWPAEAIMKLLSWQVEFVGAAIQCRPSGLFNVVNPRNVPGRAPLLECDAIGAGLLLLNRNCLEVMHGVYRAHPFSFWHKPGSDDPTDSADEDVVFARRWAEQGGRMFADPTIRVSHFAELELARCLAEDLAAGVARTVPEPA